MIMTFCLNHAALDWRSLKWSKIRSRQYSRKKKKRNAFVSCCCGTALPTFLTSSPLLLTHAFYEKKKKKRIKWNFFADIFGVLFRCFIPLSHILHLWTGTPWNAYCTRPNTQYSAVPRLFYRPITTPVWFLSKARADAIWLLIAFKAFAKKYKRSRRACAVSLDVLTKHSHQSAETKAPHTVRDVCFLLRWCGDAGLKPVCRCVSPPEHEIASQLFHFLLIRRRCLLFSWTVVLQRVQRLSGQRVLVISSAWRRQFLLITLLLYLYRNCDRTHEKKMKNSEERKRERRQKQI